MMRATLAGAVRSKVIWLNVALAVFSAVELSSAHLTTLWGPKVAAGVLFVGSIINVALRAYTTQSLAEKVSG